MSMVMSQRGRLHSQHHAPYWEDDDVPPRAWRSMRRTVKRSERQAWRREVLAEMLEVAS